MEKIKSYRIKSMDYFTENLWEELQRYDAKVNLAGTVTCTEENIDNLYNSQFPDKTVYDDKVYSYAKYK